jgi:radical SAM superfamily enzyme YgiQ (UPF0313 family)
VDILFIHPGNQKRDYQDLAAEFTAIAPPAWTLLLAGHVQLKEGSTAIYDVNVHGWDDKVPAELVNSYQPKLVIMMVYGHHPSASTQTMPAALHIAADLKRAYPALPIALGGSHPSALPEATLGEAPVDFIIQGEGVHTTGDLVDHLAGRLPLEGVRGLWRLVDGMPTLGAPPAYVLDLDAELPSYPWELLGDLSRYRAHNMHSFQEFAQSRRSDFADVRSPYVALNTSLGCPFSCDYCCTNAIFNRPGIRYWSVDRVLGWFEELVERHGVRTIRLDDELFLLSPARVEEFCDKLIARDLGLNLWVYGRVDTICSELLAKMKRAGINWICLGIESGNARVRADVGKKLGDDIVEVVRSIQSHGIHVLGNYMFGLPEDTLETMQETLNLAIHLNTEYINFYTVMAYPGSKLYERAVQEPPGALPEGWEGYSQLGYQAKPLPSRHLDSVEILHFRDTAVNTYYQRDAYRTMMTEKFGPHVMDHIDRMLAIPIHRQLLTTKEGEVCK